jgi:hypothetical protein
MADEQEIADAFWQIHAAALKINEILIRNPPLAENLPIKWPLIFDADEFAAECRVVAEHYKKLAKDGA